MEGNKILDRINSPEDIKKLTYPEMEQLAEEIRTFMIEVLSENGGHLAPNLGVVEITLALHKVFDCPRDKIVFDVGHQSYIHKIITGRKDSFPTIRKYKGLSGFPKRNESPCDAFGVGHSSTSISAAAGIAAARDLKKEDFNVIALIGDGAMTGGMAYEALNNVGERRERMIIILNDNEMSIAKNVGAMSEYLYQLRTGETYKKVKNDVEGWLKGLERGKDLLSAIDRVKNGLKAVVMPGSIFEHLGIKYFGPVDGHNIETLVDVLGSAKEEQGPVLIHVITKKGKGYGPAEEKPNKFHGTGPFDIATGEKKAGGSSAPSYTSVFGETLVELAEEDKDIVAITAAMPDGTGLNDFAARFKERFFDVGIAEQHAVTFAAGLATEGIKPFAVIYSTFLQRAYDQVLHDVCMQNLPVRFCLDRAGIVGDDGYTHHGVFDYSYLIPMPNMVLMAPKDENELRHMMKTMENYEAGPIALRYPRGAGRGVDCSEAPRILPVGKAEVLKEGTDLSIWAIGSMVEAAEKTAEILAGAGINAGVVNMRFAKPLDRELLYKQMQEVPFIVTMEEGVLAGGVGEAVLAAVNEEAERTSDFSCKVYNFGIPDELVPQGDRKLLMRDLGLDTATMANRIMEMVKAGKSR